MAKVLIAGCGDLGSDLASELVAQGHTVTGIRRTKNDFPKGVSGLTGDLVDMSDDSLPDADLVFLIMTPNGRTEEAYRAAYFDTAQVLIRRYKHTAQQPKVFFVSSTSVYGQSQGEWIDETTSAQPVSATAKVLVETEQALAAAFSSVAVRCSGIYGPGRYRLLETVLSGKEWGANSWTNRVHREDVIAALLHLAQSVFSGKGLLKHYNITDDTPVSMWEVKLCIANLLGARINLPEDSQAFIPASGKRISNHSIVETGFSFQYPSYVSGYVALVAEYIEKI
ncbi:epimerase [Marinomonas sp. CT5]|uniref:NAD-dependent epimerase/dehydratase family protein n=1 Tax=Marinomonas sp. CT5 TaxID=2066133 RepID=UPI001BAE6088|nr:NAD-dependent epimerase/dehydratase family protein [Marinomonas sp. CT5]QUX97896.1 epimerase [Marinomonas sp. CT5]